MTTKRVPVDGADVEYTETGAGPMVLFVHGVYVTGALWNDVVAELGQGFRCISPTWPLGAHGTSTDGADTAPKRPRGASWDSWTRST
ncbi:MAG: hypothetical protein QOG37_598 [Mycobacterium sp.]|nr:hypothetical protein [Mycobacterium sp.]